VTYHDRQAWVEAARARPIADVVADLGLKLRKQGKERVGPCPQCGGDDRFAIHTGKGVFNCRICKAAGDVIALVQHVRGCAFDEACEHLTGEPAPSAGERNRMRPFKVRAAANNASTAAVRSPEVGQEAASVKQEKEAFKAELATATKVTVASFIYQDETGAPLSKVDRIQYRKADGSFVVKHGKPYKEFPQSRVTPNGGWVSGLGDVRRVPYRLSELIRAIAARQPIHIVEGEAKADLLASWGLAATCFLMGAGKWREEYADFFTGAAVIIVPDNDNPGYVHANDVAVGLHGIAGSLKLLQLPGLSPKGDVIDWYRNGGTAEEFMALAAAAPEAKFEEEPAEPAHKPSSQTEPDDFTVRWHGEVAVAGSRLWFVRGTIPQVGAGLLSGQWGTYKTFVALDLACAGMSGTEIFGSEIDRCGGTLFYAAEGESEIPVRLQAAIENRCPVFKEGAPFAWITTAEMTLNLLDPDSVAKFIACAKRVDVEMRVRFKMPLVLVEIDTVVATAGFKRSGDENDSVLGARLMKEGLGRIARETDTFVLGVDHFGKTAETGTRGTSGKEDNADVVLAALGEKSLTGVVTDTRLAVRKTRGGIGGREYAFTTCLAPIDQETTLVIKWGRTSADAAAVGNGAKKWSKSLTLFRRKLIDALDDAGKELCPYPKGPVVRAVDAESVRPEFYKEYPAVADKTQEQKQDARRQAFNRALKDAQGLSLINVREIEGVQYIWLL
jgi:AAA domain/CHC2 zinc finger